MQAELLNVNVVFSFCNLWRIWVLNSERISNSLRLAFRSFSIFVFYFYFFMLSVIKALGHSFDLNMNVGVIVLAYTYGELVYCRRS